MVRHLPDKEFDQLREDLEAVPTRYHREGEQVCEGEKIDGRREDDCGLVEWIEEILGERGQKTGEREKSRQNE